MQFLQVGWPSSHYGGRGRSVKNSGRRLGRCAVGKATQRKTSEMLWHSKAVDVTRVGWQKPTWMRSVCFDSRYTVPEAKEVATRKASSRSLVVSHGLNRSQTRFDVSVNKRSEARANVNLFRGHGCAKLAMARRRCVMARVVANLP